MIDSDKPSLPRLVLRALLLHPCPTLAASSALQIAYDGIGDQCLVPLRRFGLAQVTAEDRPERVAVGYPEEAENAYEHVNVDRVSIAAEYALRDTAIQNPCDRLNDRDIEIADCLGAQHMRGMMDVFYADKTHKIGVGLIIGSPRSFTSPLETELFAEARRRGCDTLDGGGMAVFQAVGAFRLFTGREPDAARMLAHFNALTA